MVLSLLEQYDDPDIVVYMFVTYLPIIFAGNII